MSGGSAAYAARASAIAGRTHCSMSRHGRSGRSHAKKGSAVWSAVAWCAMARIGALSCWSRSVSPVRGSPGHVCREHAPSAEERDRELTGGVSPWFVRYQPGRGQPLGQSGSAHQRFVLLGGHPLGDVGGRRCPDQGRRGVHPAAERADVAPRGPIPSRGRAAVSWASVHHSTYMTSRPSRGGQVLDLGGHRLTRVGRPVSSSWTLSTRNTPSSGSAVASSFPTSRSPERTGSA